ncbi:hypothetical protein JKP88DRAFT_247967 [Tribonema minus]|uniref:Protein kinase domain-containing protein n=1 Tax=Tribonema minus TaxID=303371 RepID=A0A835YX23_9STRA|nr:hypothetical protein JKP88DRAFT_247967 [Tribonema minus]
MPCLLCLSTFPGSQGLSKVALAVAREVVVARLQLCPEVLVLALARLRPQVSIPAKEGLSSELDVGALPAIGNFDALTRLLLDLVGVRIPVTQSAFTDMVATFGREEAERRFAPATERYPKLTGLLDGSGEPLTYLVHLTLTGGQAHRERDDDLFHVIIGEHKTAENLAGAIGHIAKKVKIINTHHYGNLWFILAYAAAGPIIQFYVVGKHGHGRDLRIHDVGPQLTLASVDGRAEIIRIIAQVYRVLHLMGRCVPRMSERLPLYRTIRRPNGTTIRLDTTGVNKIIYNFPTFAAEHCTSLDAITVAYRAARTAGEFLITSDELPDVRGKTYTVRAGPLGYRSAGALPLQSIEDVRATALACCRAAQVLHAAGIVHRDFREANVVALRPGTHMVIDLELAALADQAVPETFSLTGWDERTLDTRGDSQIFSRMSDMHTIGLMVERLVSTHQAVSDHVRSYIMSLKSKEVSATDDVALPFLANLSCKYGIWCV